MRLVKFCIFVLQFKVFKIYLIYTISVPDGVTNLGAVCKLTDTTPYVHTTSARLTIAFRPSISSQCSFVRVFMKIGKEVLTKSV